MLVLFEGELAVRDTVRFIEDKLKAGIWTWDVDSNQMDWSPGLYKLLGLDPETVQPSIELLREMIISDDRPHVGETEHLIKRGLHLTALTASRGRTGASERCRAAAKCSRPARPIIILRSA